MIKTHLIPFVLGALIIALSSSLAMNIALLKGTLLIPENSCGDLIDSLKIAQHQPIEPHAKK